MLADLDEPDVEEAARLSAKLGMLDFGNGYGFASRIRQELVNNESQLRTRVQAAQRGLPSAGNAAYEDARRKLDADYASRQRLEDERLEALGRKVAANQELTEVGREARINPTDPRELDVRTGYDKAGQRYRAYERKTTI